MTSSPDHIIVSYPQPGYRRSCIFTAIDTDTGIPEKPKERTTVREMEIIFLGQVGWRQYKYMVLCNSVMFLPEETAEAEALRKTGFYVFDEIVLSVSYLGHISAIHNLRKIRERWTAIRAKQESVYKGTSATLFLQQIDEVLSAEKKLIEFISGYDMLGLYFNRWAYLHLQLPRWQQIDFYGKQLVEETATVSNMLGNNGAEVIIKGYFLDEMPEEKDGMLPIGQYSPNGDGIIRKEEIAATKKDNKGKAQRQENYSGWALYKNNRLTEAVITVEKDLHNIKYGLLWVG